MALLTYFLATLLVALVALFFHLRRFRGHLEQTGLPMVKPGFFLGSPPIALNKIRYHLWFHDKIKQLGKTFCRYNGASPSIVTIDPDFIREVTVKQFDNFTDVFSVDFAPSQTTLDVSRGDTWRSLRKLLSPTFTTGKVKSMMTPIEDLADDTLAVIEEKAKSNAEMDFKPIIGGFTIDAISKVAFGLDTKVRRGEDMEFMKIAADVIAGVSFDGWFNTILWSMFLHFPELASKMGFWPESSYKILNMTKDIMEQREEKNIHIGDFVDRLREFKKVAEPPISGEMIDAQGMVFLVAGYETTANTIGSMIYILSTQPDVQDRIVEEILDNIGSDEINHENITNLHYLEACIMETLRVHPPALEHIRTCTNDSTVNGIPVKKGTMIQMPIYASHYDPEFFPEPEKFKPERFLKENQDQIVQYTWRPFGAGNRVCIGQRFALMEIKILMAKLLSKFRLVKTDKTRMFNPVGGGLLLTYPEMIAKIEPRN